MHMRAHTRTHILHPADTDASSVGGRVLSRLVADECSIEDLLVQCSVNADDIDDDGVCVCVGGGVLGVWVMMGKVSMQTTLTMMVCARLTSLSLSLCVCVCVCLYVSLCNARARAPQASSRSFRATS